MSGPVLLLDCNYLAYRAFHTTGGLSYKDVKTGVVFGFMRDLAILAEKHQTNRILFAFDRGRNLRIAKRKSYKLKRRQQRKKEMKANPKLRKAYKEMRRQVRLLRQRYLPALGFRNVFSQVGYEADDIIASVVNSTNWGCAEGLVIVSADKDLYQLLSPDVRIWNPSRSDYITIQSFRREHGCKVSQWAKVKAIAGCSTDGVDGIKGVGEKTAIKFLQGKLDGGAKALTITRERKLIESNLELVELPFAGCKTFRIRKDKLSLDKWRRVSRQLGMRSLQDAFPFGKDARAQGLRQRSY